MDASATSHELWTALLEELKCPICKDVMREPFATPCGHTFCHDCIRKQLESRQRCPCCSAFVTGERIHPVFSLLKVIGKGQQLAPSGQALEVPSLVKFLSTSPIIESSEHVEQLVAALQARKNGLRKNQEREQLQLLRLFLETARSSLQEQLASARRYLNCVKDDQLQNEGRAEALRGHLDHAAVPPRSTPAVALLPDPASAVPETRAGMAQIGIQAALPAPAGASAASAGATPASASATAHSAAPQQAADIESSGRLAARQACVASHASELESLYLRLCDASEAPTQGPSHGVSSPQQRDGAAVRDSRPAAGVQQAVPAAARGDRLSGAHVSDTQQRLHSLRGVLAGTTQFNSLCAVAEILPRAPGSQSAVSAITFASNHSTFVTAGMSVPIKLYDYDSVAAHGVRVHKPLAELRSQSRVGCLEASPLEAQKLLSSGGPDGVINLWDMQALAHGTTFAGHRKRVWSLSYSRHQPKVFVSASDDNSVRVWSDDAGSPVSSVELSTNVCCVTCNPWDGNLIAAGTAGRWLAVYDLRSLKAPIALFTGMQKAVSYVRFLSRTEVVAACVNSSATMWDLDSLTCQRIYKGHVNERNFVGMAVNGSYIACGSETSQVHVYSKYLSKPLISHTLESRLAPPTQHVFTMAAAWKPKSSQLVVSACTGSVHLLGMAEQRSDRPSVSIGTS